MHHRPLSTSAPDVVRWLSEEQLGQRSCATYVQQSCERELVDTRDGDLRSSILAWEWNADMPGGRAARQRITDHLYDRVYRSAARPLEFGPLQWLLLAWRIYRMVRLLVDLWFECREFLEVSYARGDRATNGAYGDAGAVRP